MIRAQIAAAHAAAEVARVRAAAAGSLDPHPMAALSDDAWQYVADLIATAVVVGAAEGERVHMVDINSRYTLRPRAQSLETVDPAVESRLGATKA